MQVNEDIQNPEHCKKKKKNSILMRMCIFKRKRCAIMFIDQQNTKILEILITKRHKIKMYYVDHL